MKNIIQSFLKTVSIKNLQGAVYGNIVGLAVMAAWYADEESGSLETLLSLLATLSVFWIAHVYSHIVGHTLTKSENHLEDIINALRHDWSIVQSGIFPALVLMFGELGFIDERNSIVAAIGLGVFTLGFTCLFMARKAGNSLLKSIGLGFLMLLLGVMVAYLEVKLG